KVAIDPHYGLIVVVASKQASCKEVVEDTGPIGLRVEAQELKAGCVDSISRNDVPRERVACKRTTGIGIVSAMGGQRVVDNESAGREIYAAIRQHSKGGCWSTGGPDRERHDFTPSLEAKEEKSPVLLNRAAGCPSKLVLVV